MASPRRAQTRRRSKAAEEMLDMFAKQQLQEQIDKKREPSQLLKHPSSKSGSNLPRLLARSASPSPQPPFGRSSAVADKRTVAVNRPKAVSRRGTRLPALQTSKSFNDERSTQSMTPGGGERKTEPQQRGSSLDAVSVRVQSPTSPTSEWPCSRSVHDTLNQQQRHQHWTVVQDMLKIAEDATAWRQPVHPLLEPLLTAHPLTSRPCILATTSCNVYHVTLHRHRSDPSAALQSATSDGSFVLAIDQDSVECLAGNGNNPWEKQRIPLRRFIHEHGAYHKLRSMRFFSFFRVNRTFKAWLQHHRQRKFNTTAAMLQKTWLMAQDNCYGTALACIRRLLSYQKLAATSFPNRINGLQTTSNEIFLEVVAWRDKVVKAADPVAAAIHADIETILSVSGVAAVHIGQSGRSQNDSSDHGPLLLSTRAVRPDWAGVQGDIARATVNEVEATRHGYGDNGRQAAMSKARIARSNHERLARMLTLMHLQHLRESAHEIVDRVVTNLCEECDTKLHVLKHALSILSEGAQQVCQPTVSQQPQPDKSISTTVATDHKTSTPVKKCILVLVPRACDAHDSIDVEVQPDVHAFMRNSRKWTRTVAQGLLWPHHIFSRSLTSHEATQSHALEDKLTVPADDAIVLNKLDALERTLQDRFASLVLHATEATSLWHKSGPVQKLLSGISDLEAETRQLHRHHSSNSVSAIVTKAVQLAQEALHVISEVDHLFSGVVSTCDMASSMIAKPIASCMVLLDAYLKKQVEADSDCLSIYLHAIEKEQGDSTDCISADCLAKCRDVLQAHKLISALEAAQDYIEWRPNAALSHQLAVLIHSVSQQLDVAGDMPSDH